MNDPIKDVRLPDSAVSTVKRSEFHVIENADISDDEELAHLVETMFNFPEREYFVFLEKGAHLTQPLGHAMDGQIFRCTQTDLEFYRHPNFPLNFVKIRSGMERFDWQRELAATAKEFIRFTIVLSEWKRRELEIEQHLQVQAQKSSNPIEMKPGLWGFSIDLKKLWKLAKAKLRR
jgi:hypothetical protein